MDERSMSHTRRFFENQLITATDKAKTKENHCDFDKPHWSTNFLEEDDRDQNAKILVLQLHYLQTEMLYFVLQL